MLKKLINKHTINLASSAAMPVIGMLVLSLMARFLPKADFGSYIFFLQAFLLADIFRTGFLQTSLVKHYAGAAPDRALNVAGSAWYVGFILTISIVIIDAVLYFIFKDASTDIGITLKWFGIIYFCTLPQGIATWILQAEQRFDKLFLLQIINQGGFFILVIILISLKNVTFTTIIVSYLANNILTTLICIFSGWAQAHSIRHKSIESMKQLAHFGKFSVGTSIGASLLRTSDTFIIKLMFPIQLLGVYYIPQRLLEIFEIPMRSFVSTALPGLSAAKQRGDDAEVATIMKRYAGLLTVVILPISLVTFLLVGVVIHILFGNKYSGSEANNIFRIFLCYVIIMPIDRFFGVTLDVMNKPYLNMMKVFLMLGVNIVADIIGIYLTHSLYGVAVASLFTYYTGLIFGYVQLKKHLNFSMNDILSLGFQELKNAINNFRKKRAKV